MRRFTTWIIDGLPFEPRSRRAIDETLLDWAHEEDRAASRSARWRVALAGAIAIVRTVGGSTFREAGQVPVSWLAGRFALFAGLPAAALSLPFISALGELNAVQTAALLAVVVCEFLPMVAPLGLLLCLMWRADRPALPVAGTALLVSAAMFVLTGVLLPFASREWWDGYISGFPASFRSLAPVSDPLAVDLVGALFAPTPHPGALIALLELAGASVQAGCVVVLAEALFRRIKLRRLRWIAAVPITFLLGGGIVTAMTYAVAPGPVGRALAAWTVAMAILTVAAAIQRSTELAGRPRVSG
jgi:hypothetical protein